jgi:hypothetical protein
VKEMRGAECRRNKQMVKQARWFERKARESNDREFKASEIQRAAERICTWLFCSAGTKLQSLSTLIDGQ